MAGPKPYYFRTVWRIAAPLPVIWDTIVTPLEWPQWWKGVKRVEEISHGDKDGIGGITRYTWKSALPYHLTFDMQLTERREYKHLKGDAFGELKGFGEWYFYEKDDHVEIVCIWQVTTEKAWMNWFAFILRPIFAYNHTLVMNWGERSLKNKLGIQ